MTMNDRLVLSSAYFNITGGRRQDSADTFRVLASLHTHSGEEAALYAVSEASAPGPMGARARRLVIDVIQGEYTSRFDQPPAARLKASIEAAHRELQNEFKGHVRVGLTALVAEGSSLYLLQVPPAQAYVLHDGNLHSVNTGPPGSVPFAHSLGCSGEPEISLFRDRVEESDIIVLCSSWFAQELDGDDLRSSFTAEIPDQISESLFAHARARHAREVTCVALQAIPDEEPFHQTAIRQTAKTTTARGRHEAESDGGVLDYVDESIASLSYVWQRALAELKPPAARTRAPRRKAQPTKERAPAALEADAIVSTSAVEAAEVDSPEAGDPFDDYGRDVETPAVDLWNTQNQPPPVEHGTEELPIVGDVTGVLPYTDDNGRTSNELDEGLYDAGPAPDEEQDDLVDQNQAQGEPWESSSLDRNTGQERSRARETELDEVNSFIQNTPNLGKVAPPVQGFPDTTVAPERIYPRKSESASKRPRRFTDVVRPGRRHDGPSDRASLLEPNIHGVDTSARRSFSLSSIPPAMWLWSAIGVGVVALFAVIFFLLNSSGPAAINFPQKARAHASNALHSSNPRYQSRQLGLAYRDIRRAKRHNFPAKQVTAAQNFVQATANNIHRITAVTPTVVSDFSSLPNSHPEQLNGGAGSLFVLDSHRKIIYSTNQTPPGQEKEIAKPGEFFSGIQWNDPVLMTADGTTMLALDDKYDLAIYSGQLPVTALVLTPPAGNENPRAMTVYGGNVYILDTRNGQIWRYYGAENGSTYSATGYLTNPARKELRNGVGIAIDGDVYVGLAGGRVIKYAGQKQVGFQVHSPWPLRHLSALYTRQDLHSLFIADPHDGRILQIGKKGGYIRTMQLPPGEGQLRQITVSSDGKTLFYIGGKHVYRFTIP